MKVGFRKPSLKKSLKARTTAKWKRQAKKAIISGYGKKGSGWIKNPKKAAYNKVYHKTTFGLSDILKAIVLSFFTGLKIAFLIRKHYAKTKNLSGGKACNLVIVSR